MECLVDKLKKIAERFHLDMVYLFGSRAGEAVEKLEKTLSRGTTALAGSDLDIGVQPIPGRCLTMREKAVLASAFEDLFDVNRVDLVVLSESDPFLAANIVRGERVFERDTYSADNYDLFVLRRAGDLAPLERERIALIMGTS